MLEQQRTTIATAICAPGAGINKTISNWLQDCAGQKTDLSFLAREMPIAEYAKACWGEWLPNDVLQAAHANAARAVSKAKTACAEVKGSFAATILFANRTVWHFTSASTATNDLGTIINMKTDSPQFAKDEVTQSVR